MYEATWARMLHRVFGVGDTAVATVLAGFFLGLGLGAGIGGRYARRWSRRRGAGRVYLWLELGVALWASASIALIPAIGTIYAAFGLGWSGPVLIAARFGLAMMALLPPTIMLGATLPVVVHVVASADAGWARRATALYSANTLGAMVGAAATGFWLVPELGARVSILCAAALSAVAGCMIGCWPASDRSTMPAAEPAAASVPKSMTGSTIESATASALTLMTLAFLTGMAALCGEVLWTRVLRIVVQGTTQSFTAMLAVYLAGIATGSALAHRMLRRRALPNTELRSTELRSTELRSTELRSTEQPNTESTHTNPRGARWMLGNAQIGAAALTALAILCAPQLPRWLAFLQNSSQLVPHEAPVILALAAILLVPLSVALGMSLPFLWAMCGREIGFASRHTGRVLAANTLGGLVGSLLGGFVLVPALGTELSLIAVLWIHLLTAAVAYWPRASPSPISRVTAWAGPAALGAGIMWLNPSLELPFLLDASHNPVRSVIQGPDEASRDPLLFLREGRHTTVTVVEREESFRLYNDGRPESGFGPNDPGFGEELALLGAAPTLFAARPERALVVGLGAGHTATMLLAGPFARVDVVELEPAIVEASKFLHRARKKPHPLTDPRARLIVDDARARLNLTPRGTYDAVVSQPSHPWLAGSSALYTIDFFQESKRALRSGGVFVQWVNLFRMDIAHLRRVVATLRAAFRYVHAFVAERSSMILVASDERIVLGDRAQARLTQAPALRTLLAPFRFESSAAIAALRELDSAGTKRFAGNAKRLVDDQPALEFGLAKIPYDDELGFSELDAAFADIPWRDHNPTEHNTPSEGSTHSEETFLARIAHVSLRPRALARIQRSKVITSSLLVQGATAEALGDVARALRLFDASTDAEAAYRADSLRYRQRDHRRALARAQARAPIPTRARPLLLSTLALEDRGRAEFACSVARRASHPDDRPLIRLVEAWGQSGCSGFMPALHDRLLENEHVAWMAERCAIAQGDHRAARQFAEHRMRARRAISVEQAKYGTEAANHEHPRAARVAFQRALRANPAHGIAAAGLARLLHPRSPADAKRVLRRAFLAARGLPHSSQAIQEAARDLEIKLEYQTRY